MTTTVNTCKIIDLHSHILHGVDHGSKSLSDSIKMLNEANILNIREIACTPHYNGITDSKDNFNELQKEAKKLNIKLYLGNEIKINMANIEDILNNKVNTINNSNYLLLELERYNTLKINEILSLLGELFDYQIIFAHPELIKHFRTIKNIKILKKNGIIIQCDASSLFKGGYSKYFMKKLLKKDLVDIISSDKHIFNDNFNYLTKAYDYILKKYGFERANRLFCENPKKIINKKSII